MPDPAAAQQEALPNQQPGGGPVPVVVVPPAPAAPTRPDYLPEKFWDGKANAPRVEDMAKSYGHLEKLVGRKEEELRAKVMTELYGGRPESPDAYTLAPIDEAVDVVMLAEPPGEDFQYEPGKTYFQANPDSKALPLLRQLAHEHGIPDAKMRGLLTEVAREMGTRVPTAAEVEESQRQFYGQLGEHGQRRVQHLWGGLRNVLGGKAEALDAVVGTRGAVEALEELVSKAGGSRFAPPAPGTAGGGPLTEAELRAKMRDPRYSDARRRDPAYVAEVTEGFRTLFG